ncbi:MAG: NADH-quinone oxidoreductase subunit J [Beijerinckiaceae bacterium]|nr:MAG: NADH-quinone oxidoreductase subunit J [Beijerinckiaceae bacterium]
MSEAFEIVAFGISAFIAIAGALGMATTMSMFRSGIFLMSSFIGVAGLFILLTADLIGLLQIMMYIGGFLVMILFMVMVMHDPGGAMMAGMDMAFVERWFSKGLVPREPPHSGHSDMHADHGQEQRAHDRQSHAMPQSNAGDHRGHSVHHDEHADDDDQSMQDMDDSGHEGHAAHHGNDKSGMDMGGMDMSMVTPVRPAAAWLAGAIGVVLVSMLLLRPTWRVVNAMPDPDSARRIGQLLMEKYMIAFEGAGFLILIGIFGAVLLARPTIYPDDASRRARVAVDKKPEPIAAEGLVPLAVPDKQAGQHEPHQSEEHGA